MWKHRVKDFWVKEGDRNTRYFHKTTSGRWKNNRISGILNSYRVLVQDDALIEKCFINYFSNIFSFKGVNGLDAVFNLVHAMLSNNDIEQLDRSPSEAVYSNQKIKKSQVINCIHYTQKTDNINYILILSMKLCYKSASYIIQYTFNFTGMTTS